MTTIVTTSIACPTCGAPSIARSSFDWGHAEVHYCAACRARSGMVSMHVRSTDLVHFLPEQESTVVRHRDGLVWMGR